MNEWIFPNYKLWLWKYKYFGAITSSEPEPYISEPPLFLERLHEWTAQVLTKLYSNKRKQEKTQAGAGLSSQEGELLSLQYKENKDRDLYPLTRFQSKPPVLEHLTVTL